MSHKILTARVTIAGTRSLLWHHFGPDAIPSNGERLPREGVAGNNPVEWKRSVLVTKDGQLYLEPSQVFAAIRCGAKYTRRGRGTLQAYVAASLLVGDEIVLVDRQLPPEPIPTEPQELVYIDVRSVNNPNSKGRNIRYRIAASPGWTASFTLEWDKTIVSPPEMQSAITDAGTYCGIGDGRAIGFGRFALKEFLVDSDREGITWPGTARLGQARQGEVSARRGKAR